MSTESYPSKETWIPLTGKAFGNLSIVAQIMRVADAKYWAMFRTHISWHTIIPGLVDAYTLPNTESTPFISRTWGPPDSAIIKLNGWVRYEYWALCYSHYALTLSAELTRKESATRYWRWDDPHTTGLQQYSLPSEFKNLRTGAGLFDAGDDFSYKTRWLNTINVIRDVADDLILQYDMTFALQTISFTRNRIGVNPPTNPTGGFPWQVPYFQSKGTIPYQGIPTVDGIETWPEKDTLLTMMSQPDHPDPTFFDGDTLAATAMPTKTMYPMLTYGPDLVTPQCDFVGNNMQYPSVNLNAPEANLNARIVRFAIDNVPCVFGSLYSDSYYPSPYGVNLYSTGGFGTSYSAPNGTYLYPPVNPSRAVLSDSGSLVWSHGDDPWIFGTVAVTARVRWESQRYHEGVTGTATLRGPGGYSKTITLDSGDGTAYVGFNYSGSPVTWTWTSTLSVSGNCYATIVNSTYRGWCDPTITWRNKKGSWYVCYSIKDTGVAKYNKYEFSYPEWRVNVYDFSSGNSSGCGFIIG
jgi:hypothetical protein